MNPKTWVEMVKCSRELESSLGNSLKIIEDNEKETVVLQRRSIRLKRSLDKDQKLSMDDITFLRPCPRCNKTLRSR